MQTLEVSFLAAAGSERTAVLVVTDGLVADGVGTIIGDDTAPVDDGAIEGNEEPVVMLWVGFQCTGSGIQLLSLRASQMW